VLALLTATGRVQPWHVYAFAPALGTAGPVKAPARMSFVSEPAGGGPLPDASALSAAYVNAARVLGPATAGPLVARWGTGPVTALNAAGHPASAVGLWPIRPAELLRAPARAAPGAAPAFGVPETAAAAGHGAAPVAAADRREVRRCP
jgi:hypothetical protein